MNPSKSVGMALMALASFGAASGALTVTASANERKPVQTPTHIDCWDGTFMYNTLDMKTVGDQLEVEAVGQSPTIFQRLLNPPPGKWGRYGLKLSLPLEQCQQAPHDPRLITCTAKELPAKLTAPLDGRKEFDLSLKNVLLQLRKVEEMGQWGEVASGYELVILEGYDRAPPVLTQRYFTGLSDGDETRRCRNQVPGQPSDGVIPGVIQ